jgi:hypothetical protein
MLTFIHIILVVVRVEVSVVHWPPCITQHDLVLITVFSQFYIQYCCTKNVILQISAPKTQRLSTDVSILLITNNFNARLLRYYTNFVRVRSDTVEALHCRFFSWWGRWDFSLTWFILLHSDPGVDSAFSGNEYQGYLPGRRVGGGGKGGCCLGLTTLPLWWADCLKILGASTSWSPLGLSRSVQGLLYLYFTFTNFNSFNYILGKLITNFTTVL